MWPAELSISARAASPTEPRGGESRTDGPGATLDFGEMVVGFFFMKNVDELSGEIDEKLSRRIEVENAVATRVQITRPMQ